jgi:hypothetical protein
VDGICANRCGKQRIPNKTKAVRCKNAQDATSRRESSPIQSFECSHLRRLPPEAIAASAKVRAVTQILKGALLVPQRAVSQLQGSAQVAVVGADNKIAIRAVRTGERVDTMWVISGGLMAGDRVVAEGTQKVKDGGTGTPVPFNTASGGN